MIGSEEAGIKRQPLVEVSSDPETAAIWKSSLAWLRAFVKTRKEVCMDVAGPALGDHLDADAGRPALHASPCNTWWWRSRRAKIWKLYKLVLLTTSVFLKY